MHDPTIRWRVGQPAGPLAGVVDSYLGYDERDGLPGLHRGLPSGSMTFIISVGEQIHVLDHPDPAAGERQYRATVAGLHTRPALIRHGGQQCGVAVTLRPTATRALFGRPASALAGETVELADLVGPVGDELWERLQAAPTMAGQFALCDRLLDIVAGRTRRRETAPELLHAWHLLERSSGSLRIADVAAAVGWSRQHLRRRFRAEYGIGPKEAARVLRFDRSVDELRASGLDRSLAGLAADCGYADQSHLTNEWKELAGCTPTEWWSSERVPFVQEDDAVGV